MLIYQMTAEQIINKYGARMPNIILALEKHEVEQYAVFEQDDIPKAIFAVLLHREPMIGKTIHHLTAIATLMFDLTPKLMRRYREQYGKKNDILAYDLPTQVHVEEIEPNIVRYSPMEEPEGASAMAFHGIELDDEDIDVGDREINEIIQQAPGIRFSLGYTSPAKRASIARHLAEVHNYQITRRVYIL
ncbi:hypothetical protein BIZ78_gp094 [Erwinia phage vB_EamM_Caitlin]|uniref:hypothetical protein n=1 Tax=Erwinia phage vB_EamM_Caitlin TaxID=1883379 RepID=UPI00081C6FA9|nr:hypothetical protein BIZ78_gp094 [Erwinia phage vB_EamM_Caitlin]ANZ48481.1 hypothetical protein CAITLIN_186 [Erwinia phage vB_EamM_Caitlin]